MSIASSLGSAGPSPEDTPPTVTPSAVRQVRPDVRQVKPAVGLLTASEAQRGAAAAELVEAAEQLAGAVRNSASDQEVSPTGWGDAPVENTDMRTDEDRVRTTTAMTNTD